MVGIQMEAIQFSESIWNHIFNSVLASKIKRHVPLAKHLDGYFVVKTAHLYAKIAIISHLFNASYAASVRTTDRFRNASKQQLIRRLIVVTNVTQNRASSHAQSVRLIAQQRIFEATLWL